MHAAVRAHLGPRAMPVLAAAGAGTAAYILAHRIPRVAQTVLRAMPGALAAPILTRAIARNAWTFAGSGAFRVVSLRPVVLELADNPLVRSETARPPPSATGTSRCSTASTARSPGLAGTRNEVACTARGDPACRFEIGPG
jgi:divinyl protochlorophyllide a 8-vinyl-reductase